MHRTQQTIQSYTTLVKSAVSLRIAGTMPIRLTVYSRYIACWPNFMYEYFLSLAKCTPSTQIIRILIPCSMYCD